MAIYQKYRAKTFEEVIAQSHVKEVLQTSIKNNTFGHAYLFVGTRGTGKTSLARIFARALNCTSDDYVKKSGEPCNQCESCTQALSGSNVDIIELDAASNRGIEEVRNLIEGVDFLPSGGKYKVYIIDEVHMMTKEAFNALLKTIEEPPAHAVFIMCTTEFFKVPATIISRSQVFELKHANIDEIIQKMDKILEKEEVKIARDGQEIIAKLGKGSFRDSESILEKVINSSAKKELSAEDVTAILGLSSILLIENIKVSIYKKDLSKLQEQLSTEIDDGIISVFNLQLCESIYKDIVQDFSSSNIDGFKLEVFDLLSSLNLKNTASPKYFYIAKLLNFLKNFSNSSYNTIQASVANVENTIQKSSIESSLTEEKPKQPEIDLTSKKFSSNPAALLRERKRLSTALNTASVAEEKSSDVEQKRIPKISKMDFLEFIKSKNLFLYRLFLHNDFAIENTNLIVNTKTQMQKDLLSKPQNKNLIQEFSEIAGVPTMQLIFGDVDLDKRTSEERNITQTKKKVEDLGDEEINEIFNN